MMNSWLTIDEPDEHFYHSMYPLTSLGRGLGQSKFVNPYGNTMPFMHSQFPYQPHGQMYTQALAAHGQHDSNGVSTSVDGLTQNLGGMNLRAADTAGSVRLRENSISTNGINFNAMYGAQPGGTLYYPLPDGSLVLSSMNGAPGSYPPYPAYNLPSTQSSNFQQSAYNAFPNSVASNQPNTPQGQAWIPSQHVPREVPGLARRNSWSSNEETGPETPLYSVPGPAGYQPMVYNDHSPHTWSTPSPLRAIQYPTPQVGKAPNGEYTFMDFEAITHQDPKIPRAVPAPYSFNGGRGTLDKILDNPHQTTNVYIRGLPPNTTDAMLEQYGARFGDIETAKSIIDHPTHTCKG